MALVVEDVDERIDVFPLELAKIVAMSLEVLSASSDHADRWWRAEDSQGQVRR